MSAKRTTSQGNFAPSAAEQARGTAGNDTPKATRAAVPRGPMGHGPGRHRGAAEKPTNFKGTLKQLLGYLKPHAAALIGAVVMAIASVAFFVVGPDILVKCCQGVREPVPAKNCKEGALPDALRTGKDRHVVKFHTA